jgi:hypothetical protein
LTWAPLPILPFSPTGLPVDPTAAGTAILLPAHQYVVDPLGVNVALAEGHLEHAFEFGNKTDVSMAYGASVWTAGGGAPQAMPLLRINSGLQSEFAAVQVATLPDSWETAVEAVPIDLNRDTSGAYPTRYAEFPPTLDLSGVAQTLATLQAQIGPAGLAAISPRIVLTTADGQMTAVRTLDVWRSADATANRRVHWSDVQPLPAAFLARDIGPARIEIFDRRYTWLMTVRKSPIEWDIDASGGPPGQFEDANLNARFDRGDPNAVEIKLVVLFKRAFSAADEHVFDANFGNAAVTPFDGAGPVQSNEVVIQWAGTEPEPHIKPGNFLFDARDVTWYQIESFTSNAAGTARMTLDRPVRAVTQDANGDSMIDATNDVMGRAILMRGVVEVFDL